MDWTQKTILSPRRVKAVDKKITLEVFRAINDDGDWSIAIEGQDCNLLAENKPFFYQPIKKMTSPSKRLVQQ